jgi:hypothetical protein
MKKIPTLFKRDPENMRHVLPEITPGCEWVLAGEGVATRKYDGTCVMFDGERWWARREVKLEKRAPANFQAIETDETTGNAVGWEPVAQSAFARWLADAIDEELPHDDELGTYELCGPKINGNPEQFDRHVVISHAGAERMESPDLRNALPAVAMDVLRGYLLDFSYEGIVWHHPDGRMAKLKRRDFA